jgi:multiple sugar transport system ATP-binding protein
MIVGIRPEQFEDAKLVGDRSRGHVFRTKVDVLEALGSEYYAHSTVRSGRISSSEFEELARDTGASEAGRSRDRVPIVAHLGAASQVREGEEAELWFDTERLHLFDYESGRSLLGDAPPEPAQAAAA